MVFFRIANTIGSELFPQQWFFGVSKTRWLTKADFADKPVCNRATNISVCISIFIESRERWVVYRIRNKRIDLSYSEKNKQIVTALKLLIDIRCSLKIIRLMNTHTHACTHRNIHRPVETTKACLSKHRCHHRVCTQIRSAFVCVPIRKSGLDEFSLVRHTRFWCERYFDMSIKLLDNRFLMKFNDRARIETSRSQWQWQYTSSNVQAQNG